MSTLLDEPTQHTDEPARQSAAAPPDLDGTADTAGVVGAFLFVIEPTRSTRRAPYALYHIPNYTTHKL